MPTETSSTSSNPNLVKRVSFAPDPPKPLAPSDNSNKTIVNTDTVEAPVEAYEERHGRPLLVDILDMNQVYGKTPDDSLVKEIDSYILSEIESRNYKPTRESYEAVLKELKDTSKVTDLHDYTEQLKKMSIYAEALTKQKELKAVMELLNVTTRQ